MYIFKKEREFARTKASYHLKLRQCELAVVFDIEVTQVTQVDHKRLEKLHLLHTTVLLLGKGRGGRHLAQGIEIDCVGWTSNIFQ